MGGGVVATGKGPREGCGWSTEANAPAAPRLETPRGATGFPAAPRSPAFSLAQRPKLIEPASPKEVLEPSRPTGMLMLGFRLYRELNTNPVPSVSRP